MNATATATANDAAPAEPAPALWAWVLATLAGTIAVHWWNRDVLNTDAIAYLRLAEHYAGGRFDLAINGYWGPLLSWLMVPALKAGIPPLIAARFAMVFSTLIFVIGSTKMMLVSGLTRRSHLLGLILCCSAAAIWGAQNITPDLLLAGFALIALSFTLRSFHEHDSRTASIAGVAWGAAYLTKAIALPWAVLVIGTYALIQWRGRQLVLSRMKKICAGIAVVAVPWIIVLSIDSGRFTFSTSGRIAHTLAGPGDEVRYHPTFVTLHKPMEGRLTSWENPVELSYQTWSPLKSRDYLAYQIKLTAENLVKILFIVTSIVPAWPLFMVTRRRRQSFMDRPATVQAILPLDLLCLIYLPVYLTINEQRYFYIALPLLWIALNMKQRGGARSLPAPGLSMRVQAGAFAVTLIALMVSTLAYQIPSRTAGSEARELAQWLETNHHSGPVAGSGMRPGGRTGLYTAWFLGQPWYGDSRAGDAQSFIQSGARLLVVSPNDPLVAEFEKSPDVERLQLPGSLSDKLAVFEIER